MEFKIKRNEFFGCISRAQSIIEKTSNMPILSTVLISSEKEHITVSATDLELSFQETIPAETISQGSAAIPGRKLFEIIKETKGQEFHVKKEENERIFISDGNTEFRLASLPAEEFPLLTEPENVNYSLIQGADLKDMIKRTIYTVTTENIGFKLSGTFVEKREKAKKIFLRFVATDGHRLSMVDKQLTGIEKLNLEQGILVPKKGMTEINKLIQEEGLISVGLKDKNFIIKKENRILIIRLLDVKFPNYENVIPERADFVILLNRMRFIEALRRMLIFSTEKYRAVKMIIKEDRIELSSSNAEIGEAFEAIEVEHKGKRKEKMEIAFNPKFFIDALQPMQSEFINLGFIDKDRPCVITGEDDQGFLALIMPIRL